MLILVYDISGVPICSHSLVLKSIHLFGLGDLDLDLDAGGDALTLRLFGDGEGDLFLGGERDAGDLDRRAAGERDLRGGDLDLGLRPGLRLSLKGDLGAGDLLRPGDDRR